MTTSDSNDATTISPTVIATRSSASVKPRRYACCFRCIKKRSPFSLCLRLLYKNQIRSSSSCLILITNHNKKTFTIAAILNQNFSYAKFYVLNDGTYLILNNQTIDPSNHNIFFIVDINGSKGPNKWGYDIYYMTLSRKGINRGVIIESKICAMKEKGGMYVEEMLRE